MGLDCMQLRLHVVRPTLQKLRLWSMAAENLVLGTAAHESAGFRFLDQITGPHDAMLGPAYGIYQIEPATHADLFENFLRFHADLWNLALDMRAHWPDPTTQLATNLTYQTAICRLQYYRAKPPLPAADDVEGLAAYWKRWWNTPAGKGTEAQFIEHYRRYVR